MTVRDRDVLDLLREDPELLAIADAVASTQREPRRRGQLGRSFVVVGLVAVALFALVLASPWDRDGGRGLVLDRALAAIKTRGPVLHVALRISQGFRVELSTGRTTQPGIDIDVWYDKKQRLAHLLARRDGHVLVNETVSASARDLSFALFFPIGFDEADFYRDALANGKAKVVGTGIWHGRAVYWLKLGGKGSPGSFRVGIDRSTYRPVVFRGVDARERPTGSEIGLVTLEYVPVSEAHFGKISPGSLEGYSESGGSSGLSGSPSLTPAKARLLLGVPAAWAGPSFSGFPLADISVEDADYEPHRGRKVSGKQLRLAYGRAPSRRRSGARDIEIVEVPARSPLWGSISDGPPPPTGFADLTISEVGTSSGASETRWTATLSAAGVWASIEAPTRELAIAAARALRPIPRQGG